MERSSGIFLHPTSLPSQFGIGDLGKDAYRWIDMLADARQMFWQVCPLGPTGYGYSPYLTLSSFAGNHLLISPQLLAEEGLLSHGDIAEYPNLSEKEVEYWRVEIEKERLFQSAFERFEETDEYNSFCEDESWWLDDYALFVALKKRFKDLPWNDWEDDIRSRDEKALEKYLQLELTEVKFQKFLQFYFHRQWHNLKNYANSEGVLIFGDVPYYTAYDSSDAWADPEIFDFDKKSKPKRVGGVPPDYFSAEGQLWGNPVFNWKLMKENGYKWWIGRIKKALDFSDWVRIDHFRGLEAYWSVKYGEKTAINGKWVKGPGLDFFKALKSELGDLPLIAEDLGVITDKVDQLRLKAGLPGMKVLQFAFDGNPDNPYIPHNIDRASVIYTGTHDNDTSIGWYHSLPNESKDKVRKYLACNDSGFIYAFLRLAMASVADLSIIPFQDVLHLDGKHRFNTPGTGKGNWKWRFTWGMAQENKLDVIREYTEVYGRCR